MTLLFDYAAPIAIALGGLLTVLLIWWLTILLTALSARKAAAPSIPVGVTITAQPLMTPEEAQLYNVLTLAVQDDYLLFAQIPLWCLVDVQAHRPQARQAFLAQIALKRVDFVLVHPGTLTVVKVVELDGSPDSPQRQARNKLVEETLKAAGIDLVRLSAKKAYTIPELAALLDIEAPE
ncbi:DUF2726 domain-containing protein [Candidatus Nitrospira bockiana]